MRALVYNGPEVIELEELEAPTCAPGEVLLEVLAAGVCGSDLNGYLGRSARRVPPLVLGHELCARIVTDPTGANPEGTRVAVFPLINCGLPDCEACAGGHSNRCDRRRLMGLDLPGGFSDLVTAPSTSCFPLPDSVNDVAGALIEPLANAIHLYDAVLRLGGPVRRVAIIGGGGQGLMALLVGSHFGLACDVIEPNPARRARAAELGAHRVYHPEEWALDTEAATREPRSANGGYEAVIDTAGFAATRRLAVHIAAPGAVILYLGLHDASSTADDLAIINRELTIKGSYAYTKRDFQRALALVVDGAIDVEAFSTRVPLSAGADVFDRLAHNPEDLIKAVFVMKEGGQ